MQSSLNFLGTDSFFGTRHKYMYILLLIYSVQKYFQLSETIFMKGQIWYYF